MKRSKTNTYYNFNAATAEELDPISKKIYDGLCNGENKKVLSNKYKVPMTAIIALQKRFKTGTIANSQIPEMEQETESDDKSKVIQIGNDSDSKDTVETKSRKKRKTVHKEDIDLVIEFVKDGYTSKQIAELTNLSLSTISRIRTNNLSECRPSRANNKQIVTTEDHKTHSDIVPIGTSIRVGLVADRHNMPVNDFIFKTSLSKSIMFDYNRIEDICREYIDEMVDFINGKAQQKLIVYVTGIQCVLSSLIKVTNEKKVNLTLRHYDSDSNTYHTHVIWDQFGGSTPAEIDELLVNSKSSYTYKCDIKELIKNKTCIKVVEVHYNNDTVVYQDAYLVKSTDDMFMLVSDMMKKSDKDISIYAKGYDLIKGRFVLNGIDLKLKNKN